MPSAKDVLSAHIEEDAKEVLNRAYEVIELSHKEYNNEVAIVKGLKDEKIQTITDISYNILEHYYKLYLQKKLSLSNAKAQAIRDINNIKYDQTGMYGSSTQTTKQSPTRIKTLKGQGIKKPKYCLNPS